MHKVRKNNQAFSLKSLFCFLYLIPAVFMIQSCYSTTAVKGTPVKDIAVIKEKAASKKAQREAQRKEILKMSRVRENETFVVIDGIPEYRIGPLDVLEVTSRIGAKSTTTTVKVGNRGKISYSFVDDLEVSGLSPSEVDAILTNSLKRYIKNPRIDVLVKEFKSKSALILGELTAIRGTLYGAKGASGKIYLEGKTSLMDLIALAGGYTVDADIRNVKLIRRAKTYLINLYDIIEKADDRFNVIIDSGDVVDIPELPEYGERIYVMGEVYSQGVYSLKDAKDLLGAIALAGSFTPLAKEENTLIVRALEPGKKPLVMMADLKALFRKADLAQNTPLEDGDLVYVPRMLIGDINDWIANTMPLLSLILYPAEFESKYFLKRHLHFDRKKSTSE